MKIKSLLAGAAILASSLGSAVGANQETVEEFKFDLKAEDYMPGTRQYLVYMEDKESGKVHGQSIWTRKTELKSENGEELVEITQKWTSNTKGWAAEKHSISRIKDFTPLRHTSLHGADGTSVSAFIFEPTLVRGDDRTPDNTMAGFSMEKAPSTLNWELDMEIFSMLPFEVGKTFKLNFYHPGSKTAARLYDYTVTREEILEEQLGGQLDCWVMHIKYGEQGSADFWIDKRSRQVVKMVEDYGKVRRYKILLSVPFGPAERMQ